MHIAVCDDNVADRKQLERLMKRESDKRMNTSGNIYVDSFGNAVSLLANPMQYDAFYIDMCKTEGVDGIAVANSLISQGVNAPIVMCCSHINYREHSFPENVLFLDKPIKVAELSSSLDHCVSIVQNAVPLIELREDKNTVYVTEPDILYAVEDGRQLLVSLTDGRRVPVSTNALNFFSQVESHPSFIAPSAKVVLNGRYIARIGFRKVIMADGSSFRIHRDCMSYTRYIFEQMQREQASGSQAASESPI